MVNTTSSPFGGQGRTRVLLALRLLGESYARELARGLELDGLVAARSLGRTRVFQLNPRYFASAALSEFLRRLVEPEADLRDRVAALRRRPRRTGKPL